MSSLPRDGGSSPKTVRASLSSGRTTRSLSSRTSPPTWSASMRTAMAETTSSAPPRTAGASTSVDKQATPGARPSKLIASTRPSTRRMLSNLSTSTATATKIWSQADASAHTATNRAASTRSASLSGTKSLLASEPLRSSFATTSTTSPVWERNL